MKSVTQEILYKPREAYSEDHEVAEEVLFNLAI